MHEIIETNQAPRAIGPYSQAIVARGTKFICISGQIPLDPISMKVVSPDILQQTQQVLKNLLAVIHKSGAQLEHIIKTTVYIKNMDDFKIINQEYEKYFCNHKPARVCVEVSRLPKDVLVEIDALAIL